MDENANLSSIIIVIVGSGALAAFMNGLMTIIIGWRNERKTAAETRQIDTTSDSEVISSLISVTKLYAEQITTLSAKVTVLEDRAEKRKTDQVDLEIRVKKLEADLIHRDDTIDGMDATIAMLKAALNDCRAAVRRVGSEGDYIDNQ